MPAKGTAQPCQLIKSDTHAGGRRLFRVCLQGPAVATAVVLCACVTQEPPSKLQQNAEAYCREQGFRRGTEPFESCVETTRQEIIDQARDSYRRLIRGDGR